MSMLFKHMIVLKLHTNITTSIGIVLLSFDYDIKI